MTNPVTGSHHPKEHIDMAHPDDQDLARETFALFTHQELIDEAQRMSRAAWEDFAAGFVADAEHHMRHVELAALEFRRRRSDVEAGR